MCFQDEKNQILTTNIWLNMVRFTRACFLCLQFSRISIAFTLTYGARLTEIKLK